MSKNIEAVKTVQNNFSKRENPPANPKKINKHRGLYLKFESRDDKNIHKAMVITSIFDGTLPLYFYYTDSGRYEKQRDSSAVSVNPTMLGELKRILGDKNVAVID